MSNDTNTPPAAAPVFPQPAIRGIAAAQLATWNPDWGAPPNPSMARIH